MSCCWSLVFTVVILSYCVPVLLAQDCRENSAHYNGYLVRKVEMRTPIAFFAAATFGFDQIKARLPIQANQPFSARKLSEGTSLIRDDIRLASSDSAQRLKIVIATGKPTNCDSSARTLNVVYTVFTNVYRPYLSHTFEERKAEIQRPATTGAEGGTQGRFLIKPFAGYNHTRRGYGGVEFSAHAPLAIFTDIEAHPSISSNSTVDSLEATGSWDPRRKALEHTEWRLGLHYLDLPAGPAKLKEGKLVAQLSGSTNELSPQGDVFRFGLSLEGGHQQSVPAQPVTVLPNSSFGAIKLYAGVTGRTSRQTFAASYGVELGSTLRTGLLDFTKHVVDFGYSKRFLRGAEVNPVVTAAETVHRPWDFELRASGGIVQELTGVPAAERFFGGNQVQNFIAGDAWVIPNGAFIRSVPENRLGSLSSNGRLGGTRFYSGNATVSKVLWGRSLLPKELAQDPEFLPALNGAIETAKGTLADFYKSKDPAFSAATSELKVTADTVEQLKAQMGQLPATTVSNPAIASTVNAINSRLATIHRTLSSIANGKKNEITALLHLQLPGLEKETKNLEELLKQAGQNRAASSISESRESIENSRQKLQSALAAVNTKAAQAHADADFSTAQKVLNSFLYELNIYSIAPVGIFDAARVWPASTGTHYAVGGGVRLSLVNLNFTLGYAANLVRQSREGPGALFASLDVSDLFH